MKRQILKTGLIGMVIITCISCNKRNKIAEESHLIKPSFLESVKMVETVLNHPEQELTLTGRVEYNPDRIIAYVPLISGVVDRVSFSLGDKVQQGQPMIDFRSVELSALLSEKNSLEVAQKIALRELIAVQSMFDDNMLSERELLEAQGKVQQIRTSIEKLQSDLSPYGTDRGSGIFTIHAPMTGYVVQKKALTGGTVSADGEAVFTIADLTSVWVTANVYASNLLFVREGMEVEMTTISYPGERFYGRIGSLSQVFDPDEKTLKARIVMDNAGLRLKPEMSMLVKLKDKSDRPMATVPSEAILFDDNRYFAVIEESAGRFAVRNVVPFVHNNGLTYIAEGLSAGERVVVAGQLLIYQGLKEE
jgi:cobalt-zinc-cadmium efflux system membrane fusion protein